MPSSALPQSAFCVLLFLSRERSLPQRLTPTDGDTIDDDDIILEDRIRLLDVAMPRPPHPIDAGEQYCGADDQTAPVHVVDGRCRDGHIQRAEVHNDDEHRPADRNDVDKISPAPEIEVRSRGKDATSADQDDYDGHSVPNLQRHAAGGDDGLECKVAA